MEFQQVNEMNHLDSLTVSPPSKKEGGKKKKRFVPEE